MQTLDAEALARDFVRALRAQRSQRGFSRRLGYRTNIAYRWESGRCWPTAAGILAALDRLGHAPREKLRGLYARPPAWLERHRAVSARLVAALLHDMQGDVSHLQLAKASGFSRFQVSRWLNGVTEPRLPEFFRMLDAMSSRALEFVALFFDPAGLPSVAGSWKRLEALRLAAYEAPWSHAVLRVLELEAYAALPRHRRGWIAERLGIAPADEKRALELLAEAGQVRWDGRHYQVVQLSTIDTRRDPARSRELRAFWIAEARKRLQENRPGFYSYNLFSVSERDFQRIRELHLRYYREMRAIVAESKNSERVGLFCTQLMPLDPGPWPGA